MFARHARNSFGGLRLTKWVSMVDSTIVQDVSINGMKDASGIFGTAEYAKENEVEEALMQENLKPCPFCGNPNVLLRNVEYDKTLWIIECNQCQMEVAAKHRDLMHGRKSTHDDLVNTWNRRC